MIFDPEGMGVEEFYDVPSNPQLWDDFMIPPERFFGKHIRHQNSYDFVEGRTKHISTNAGAEMLSGALFATEVALILSGKRSKQSIVTIPQVTHVDLFERFCSVCNAREL
ncbi:MAG: hypothetical protein KBA26_11485 [Candidatus Delongbacteria bacterium]|nr:hypothetical protein [Candidatus Delongbacteria bacterium]